MHNTTNTVFPIRLTKTIKRPYKLIEWKLGNTCNYDCSFCDDSNKTGNEQWLDFETYVSVCDQFMASTDDKIFFQFTGGEPTLYPRLDELVSNIKSKGHYVSLFSNGSRTIRWWKDFAENNLLDCLNLTVHVEQSANIDHLIAVINLFKTSSTHVYVQCTATLEYFDETLLAFNRIKKETSSILNLKSITNTKGLIDYNQSQLTILKSNSVILSDKFYEKPHSSEMTYYTSMILEYSDGTRREHKPHTMVATNNNKFFGWKCSVGINYINIMYDKIYKAMCKQDGVISTVYDTNLSFTSEYTVCLKSQCLCPTDLLEDKYNPMQF
jgi:organic radical activating enzyme